MAATLKGSFETRRDAEMAIERLVQEYGVERTDIFIAPEGEQNSVGEEIDGSDAQAAEPGFDERDDGAFAGRILLSVDLDEGEKAAAVRSAFEEFGAGGITAD